LDSPGTLHHVMIRGIERGEIVGGVKDRKAFVERMRKNGDVRDLLTYWTIRRKKHLCQGNHE
jgi:hypothetical protein